MHWAGSAASPTAIAPDVVVPYEPPATVSPTTTLPRPDAALSTFLLTDIAGSTRLWEEHADAMGTSLAIHDELLRSAITSSGGVVVKTMGDGMLAVFTSAISAIDAALTAQRGLRDTAWGPTGPLRVRMAIHAGTAESREGDFFGQALNRDARILAIGHGGQVLLSAVATALTRDRLPAGVELLDLGSHRLRDLDRPEQVFQLAVADLGHEFPPLRSLSTRRSNLPVPLTSFVGRQRELAEVDRLLERNRLVTLIGTGGTGKTRLMIEVAGRVAERFEDGVWLAELAALADPGEIGPEIARALGVSELPGRPATDVIADFLASKELLLVLDNAEHLIEGVARLTERLLASAPGLRILTTSREALAVPGEAVVQVPSLTCPVGVDAGGVASATSLDEASGTEAVALFTERACSVLPSFELTGTNVSAVSEICRRLDGIPLAIELAAGRVAAMSPEEIAVGLSDRFRLLTGGRRTAVPRQQTLHALIDWSWDLLTDDDRRLLRRLSIFSGGWTVPAAARVAGEPGSGDGTMDAIDDLTRLVDRSLVIVDRGATTRYRMLETIRQYAREQLIKSGEAAEIAGRHLRFFAAMAEAAAPELRGPSMVDWLDRLDGEIENLGAALEWGLEAEPETAIRMTIALLDYWIARVPSPDNESRVVAAIAAGRAILAGPPDPTKEQRILAVRLLGKAARKWSLSGQADVAIGWAEQAVPLAEELGDPQALIDALLGQTTARIFTGARGDIHGWLDEVIRQASAIGDWFSIAFATSGIAVSLGSVDPATVEEVLVVGADAAHRSGNPHVIALTAMGQGNLLARSGRLAEARVRLQEGIDRFAELGDERLADASRSEIAHVLRRAGDLDEAMAMYRVSIHGWVRTGNRGAVAHQLENIAFVLIARRSLDEAARLIGAAAALRDAAHSPMIQSEQIEYDGWVARLHTELDRAAIETAMAAGRLMTMTDAVALATTPPDTAAPPA
jgi:predicted ATPase/class 3 adenylate cyclase